MKRGWAAVVLLAAPVLAINARADDATPPSEVNSFEAGRFFVDKLDSAKTIDETLFQGNFTSSSFYHHESGGLLPGEDGQLGVTSNSPLSPMFTDLRAQFDARHIDGGHWDFRFDGRVRLVDQPGNNSVDAPQDYGTGVQSGVLGQNEYELRELWLAHTGDRADVFIGRQFISDLAAVKIDGVRVDYAESKTWTLLGFAGLYPERGSRSVTTDYADGKDADGNDIGRVIPIAGGVGAAYRTPMAYGAFGGVVIVPFDGEPTRGFVTSNGYVRANEQFDVYHFAIFDFAGVAKNSLTNGSVGLNYRPVPRLRLTASFNHVDTETLNLTAQEYLHQPDIVGLIQNDVAVSRISSDEARAGISVALGEQQQIELSSSFAYRRRPEIPLTDGYTVVETIPAASSDEIYLRALHRNVWNGLRLGVDMSRWFGTGGETYARSSSLATRVFSSREFADGRGEWELEADYATSRDDTVGTTCINIDTCYGASNSTTIEAVGTLYFRVRGDLFVMAIADIAKFDLTTKATGTETVDPAVLSLTGYLRLAYRY